MAKDVKQLVENNKLKIKNEELQEFSESQMDLIVKLKKENEFLRKKLSELERMLLGTTPISQEELICIQQIAILRDDSLKRALTLEEVKKLDLLVKNLRLIREQSTQVIDLQEIPSDDELLKIATANDEQPQNNN